MQYTLLIEDRNGIIANELTFEQGSFSVGRVEGNDVVLNSGTVSRNHARVFTDNNRCFVEDLNSSNGVLLDGQRIVGTAELSSGSQIRIGDYLLVLRARAPAGAPSPPASPVRQPSSGRRPRVHEAMMYPRLVRVGDALEGETFALTERENTIGRTDDNAVLLSDASVSRNHAKVIVDGGRYVVTDLGSSNGTRVNSFEVRQPTLLNPGDVVRFGSVRFALAAPGQTVDLREYSRYLGASSRGLVVAVTVLALLLVLVASGIGIFVVLDRRGAGSEAGDQPALSATDRARALKAEGDALAREEQWNEAIVKYELALNFDPSYQDAAAELRRSQAEFNASRIVQEADMNIHSADQIEREGNPSDAAQLYDRARSRLQNVPAQSAYFRSAQDRITMLIDPALIEIHRDLAGRLFDTADYPQAAHHYQRALDTWEALPSAHRSDIVDDLRNRLWRSLIAAGDANFEAADYAQAVTFYEQAQLMGELRRDATRRLRQAREHL